MNKIISGICIVAALVLSQALFAGEAPLSNDAINQYIQSLREMEPLAERINAADTEGASEMAQLWLDGDTQAIASYLKTKDYFNELSRVIERAGFKDVDDWVKTAQRVTHAFMAVEFSETGAGMSQHMDEQMNESLARIRDSDSLSDEQKATMLQQLEASKSHLDRIDKVSDADRRAIQPYMDQLRKLFQPPEQ